MQKPIDTKQMAKNENSLMGLTACQFTKRNLHLGGNEHRGRNQINVQPMAKTKRLHLLMIIFNSDPWGGLIDREVH